MTTLRDPKRRPTHPGEILREDVLPSLGMTQTELGERLGVSRLTVSELLHGKRALSADMAMRLARLLGTTPESWLNMQQALDLWALEQAAEKYREIRPVRKAAQGDRRTRELRAFGAVGLGPPTSPGTLRRRRAHPFENCYPTCCPSARLAAASAQRLASLVLVRGLEPRTY
jgi:addiction module HigA family antidote